MRVNSIKLRTGQNISLGNFTVLVGPNNVGKSRTLRDIQTLIISGGKPATVLVDQIRLDKPSSLDVLLESLGIVPVPHPVDREHSILRGVGPNISGAYESTIALAPLRREFNAQPDLNFLTGFIGPLFVSYMDASSRLSSAQSTTSYNPHANAPSNLLQALFKEGQKVESELAEVFQRTFGMQIKLDYSGMQNLTLRVAKRFTTIPADPRDAFPVFQRYALLDEQGDGYRSFVGVVLSALLSKNRIVLLDEPEAFLHPAQARALGAWLAQHANASAGQMIIATHNANFLAGIVSANKEVNLFRLNRDQDHTTFTQIAPAVISDLATSPVLSSQRILESMFFKGVAVCESDADRAIYETVSSQIVGFREILFVHAHNKQTIKPVVELLKRAAVPVCAVADIDILNSRDELAQLAKALNRDFDEAQAEARRKEIAEQVEERPDEDVLSELERSITELLSQLRSREHTLAGARGALNRVIRSATTWSEIKKVGIDALGPETRESARALLEQLASSGLFVVPVGELESWIDVGTSRKKRWVLKALSTLAERKCPPLLRAFVVRIGNYLGEKPPEADPSEMLPK